MTHVTCKTDGVGEETNVRVFSLLITAELVRGSKESAQLSAYHTQFGLLKYNVSFAKKEN